MPEQIFSEPLDTGKEQTRIDEIQEILSYNRFFLEGPGKGARIGMYASLIAIAAGFVLLIFGFLMTYFTNGEFGAGGSANWIAWTSLALVLVGMISIVILANVRPALNNAFVTTSSGELWCVIAENPFPENSVSRKELLNARRELNGPSTDLTNKEIRVALSLADMIESVELGNSMPEGYDVDLIEDIEEVTESDDKEQITITYRDRFSGERRDLSLDRYRWDGFVSWLNAQYFDEHGVEIGEEV